jgi:hydroxymethylglutaryl-CoA synthase
MQGIISYGVYIPSHRIKREEYVKNLGSFSAAGVEEKAVLKNDEDVISMAVEAAQGAMENAKVKPEEVGTLCVGLCASREKSASSVISEALGLRSDVLSFEFSSGKAGTSALICCAQLAGDGVGLAVVSDAPSGKVGDSVEHGFGAASAAFVLGSKNCIASIDGFASFTKEVGGGRFEKDGKITELGVATFSRMEYETLVAGAAKTLMKKMKLEAKDFAHAIVQQTDARTPLRVVKKLGMDEKQAHIIVSKVGDAGAATTLLGLASVLENAKPKERILLVSYASGGTSDAVAFTVEKESGVKAVKGALENKKYIDFPTYLRWKKVL